MNNDAVYYRFAMKAFADFSGTIAVPAIAAAFLGKWLDQKYGTEPRYLILCLALTFAATAFTIYKKAKRYQKTYEKIITKTETDSSRQ